MSTTAEVYAGADVKAKTLGMVTHGESPFPIIDKQPGWYAIDLMGAKWFPKGSEIMAAQSGWIKADAGVPVKIAQAGYVDSIKKVIVDKVHTIYVEYKNNPYFLITGFSVEISIPPSASLDFEFK